MAATALLLVGGGLGFSLTACGRSSSGSAPAAHGQDFITKLNGVCDKDNQQQSAVGPPPNFTANLTVENLPVAAAYLDKELPILQGLVAGFSQLGEPPQNQQAFDGAFAAVRKAADDAQAADQAAKAGDLNSFAARLTSYKGEVNQADNLIHSFGTTHCAPGRGDSSGRPPSSAGSNPATTS